MKKIIEILKALIAKLCKPVQVEVKVSSEKVEEVEKVETPVTSPTPTKDEKVAKVAKPSKKVSKPVTSEKPAKRRGRPRKVKAE